MVTEGVWGSGGTMTSINLGFFTNWHSSLHSQAPGLWHISPFHTETHTHAHILCWSPCYYFSSPPPDSWSWKKFCTVAITQVFYRSFQRRKIRAIVSGWSYGQKLCSYWVHLCLWLRSLHTDGAPLLGKGASEATDWAWEQMQSCHNPCIPSSFHLFVTHTTTHDPSILLQDNFCLDAQAPSIID